MMTPHIEFGGIGLPELLVVAVGFVGDQDFASGTFTNSGKFNTASAREPAPFNTFCGSDVCGGPNYGAIERAAERERRHASRG